MGLSAKLARAQLALIKPLLSHSSLETTRKWQDKLGELMEAMHRKNVIIKDHSFRLFEGAWAVPCDERRQGVILYLHGGGYTCGDLEYAKGFASTLAAESGTRVFCAAYRLAPENRYPAALEDATEAYRYLLRKGYSAKQIVLCGESAGGGLIYALCLRLRELGLALPAGLIGISPWTDLTSSGASYTENAEVDPSMTVEQLQFYADCYTDDRENPLVSPLFGELDGFPPSLLFVGGDEIMLDDTRELHRRLLDAGCKSKMIVAPERWHAYVLYNLTENTSDFGVIGDFLNEVLSAESKLRWMRLDNAGKIYPASRRKNWSNVFRLSAVLSEPVDTALLQSALDVTVRRFPSIAVRLRRGMFWYYLEQISAAPRIQAEQSYPLTHMSFSEMRRCAFRVVVYKSRVSVEIFHAITDGTGGMIFLKTLLAEYLSQRYSVAIPATCGVLGRLEEPSDAETEDSFLKYAGAVSATRRAKTAYQLSGTREPGGFLNLTTMMLDVGQALAASKSYKVTLTEFLCAAMMKALLELQEERVRNPKRRKPIKVLIPVNLRQLFESRTLRNFVLFVTPECDPMLGDYSIEELCSIVHHRMGMEANAKRMSAKIATNVKSEKSPVLKVMPLFIKNAAMRAAFDMIGERKSCLCLSNLGAVRIPEAMRPYIARMDFVIGAPSKASHNCGVISYGDTLYINMIRNTCEPTLELRFFKVLQQLGLNVKVESNQR